MWPYYLKYRAAHLKQFYLTSDEEGQNVLEELEYPIAGTVLNLIAVKFQHERKHPLIFEGTKSPEVFNKYSRR